MELELGRYRRRVDARLERWDDIDLPGRLMGRDPSLWGGAGDMLGWLSLGIRMPPRMDAIFELADAARSGGIKEVVLLGMGGSSMAPCVFGRTFGAREGCPGLKVLDSTHPEAVLEVAESIDPGSTMFIVSSKSGKTIETMSLSRYFWGAMGAVVEDAGGHFVAITDRDTPLDELATRNGFRRTFTTDADIGGRYSALSEFGLVPAAMLGVDARSLLASAFDDREDIYGRAADRDGLVLGAALGELTSAGRDKITLITSDQFSSFPLWTEQLMAESTGKDGKGMIPITGEPWLEPDAYPEDRTFVGLALEEDIRAVARRLEALADAGHPTALMTLRTPIELGRAMLEWEVAIASAATILGINPFNQPDVQATKERAWDLVSRGGPREKRNGSSGTAYLDDRKALMAAVEEWTTSAREDDYICIQAYLGPGTVVHEQLRMLQGSLLSATGLATTLGDGPRFLHSTGQLHKGGPNTGMFLQLVDSAMDYVPIPGEDYSFTSLTYAEALGDLLVLRDRDRRVLRIDLNGEGARGVERLRRMMEPVLRGPVRVRA